MNKSESHKYYNKKFSEIPLDWFPKAKKVFEDNIGSGWQDEAKYEIRILGLGNWFVKKHFTTGMWLRNKLRQAGMMDNELPDGNWDDYYVPLLEWWLGFRILC